MELALGVGSLIVSLITIVGFALQMQKNAKEKREELMQIGYKQKEDEQLKSNLDHAFDKIRAIQERMDKHEAENKDYFHTLELRLNTIDSDIKSILTIVKQWEKD